MPAASKASIQLQESSGCGISVTTLDWVTKVHFGQWVTRAQFRLSHFN